jgi:hypothetical protein
VGMRAGLEVFSKTLRFLVVKGRDDLPVFQNRDGWPAFKFYMGQDAMYSYRKISNLKYIKVLCFSEHYTKAQNND